MYSPNPCDDQEFCTIDYCDEEAGRCEHIWYCRQCEDNDDCDDGDRCTVDSCLADRLCGYDVVECPNDRDPCTRPRCDPAEGCVFDCIEPCAEACRISADCDDGDICTVDTCLPGTCGPVCEYVPQTCDPPGPCRVALCAGAECVTSVPVATPALDGVVRNDWHSGSLAAVETDPSDWPGSYLSELRVQVDENLLHVGIRGRLNDSTKAVVGYLDVDWGAGTGVSDLSSLTCDDGALDSALCGCAAFIAPGFQADVGFGTVGMASAYGAAELAGWRRLTTGGTPRWMTQGAVVANHAEGGVEATIPLDALRMGGLPAEGTVMALVVLLTDAVETCVYADQSLPNQNAPLEPGTPLVTQVYRFALFPALVDCCASSEDCRDNDPCTLDVCGTDGTCRHLETECGP